jgi:hypothetical protein
MTDLPSDDSRDGPRGGPDRASPPGIPRWVKVSGIIAAVVVALLVVVALVAGGEHGPSRHQPGGDNPGGHAPPVQQSL